MTKERQSRPPWWFVAALVGGALAAGTGWALLLAAG